MIAGDVRYNDVEELDVVEKGGDYGWPCLEGAKQTPAYHSTSFCRDYYARHARRSVAPWFALAQPRWQTVVAGTSLERARGLPENFRTQYAFADWAVSEVSVTDVATDTSAFRPDEGFPPRRVRRSWAGAATGRFRRRALRALDQHRRDLAFHYSIALGSYLT